MNLTDLGYPELTLAGELLKAVGENGYPQGFSDSGFIELCFEASTGEVFLSNGYNDKLTLNSNGKLEVN